MRESALKFRRGEFTKAFGSVKTGHAARDLSSLPAHFYGAALRVQKIAARRSAFRPSDAVRPTQQWLTIV